MPDQWHCCINACKPVQCKPDPNEMKSLSVLGTDATHAEHIETIKNRKYVGEQQDRTLVPGELGMGLVEGTLLSSLFWTHCQARCIGFKSIIDIKSLQTLPDSFSEKVKSL